MTDAIIWLVIWLVAGAVFSWVALAAAFFLSGASIFSFMDRIFDGPDDRPSSKLGRKRKPGIPLIFAIILVVLDVVWTIFWVIQVILQVISIIEIATA